MPDRRMNGLTRRRFALGTAVLAVAAPAIVRAQGLTKVKITQPSESLSYMPIYVGRARNFFKEVGIEVELVVTRGDGPDVQALMVRLGLIPVASPPPAELQKFLAAEIDRWGGIIQKAGVAKSQ